jgi:putative ABC transport system substrate-binding protein
MKRRSALRLAGAVLAMPWIARAQKLKRFRVGCLWMQSESAAKPYHEAFVAGLREHGYIPGRDIVVDARYAAGDASRLPALAGELISLKPDVLVGVEVPARAIRAKTTAIPIVLPASVDPVATGLVQTFARPGVNVTGMAFRLDELAAKNIELLAEIKPAASRLALLRSGGGPRDPSEPIEAQIERYAREAAAAKRLELVVAQARDAQSVRDAFAAFERAGADLLVVVASPYTMELRNEIAAHARGLRLPAISALPPEWADAGGLLSYGPDFLKNYRYAARFVDRILKGANAAEMPIEHPDTFQLVVNLRTAREIGAAIPHSILLRADRVIE